jgi:hypothetical protein
MKKMTSAVVVLAAVLALCSVFAGATNAQPLSQHVTLSGYITCTTCLMPNACKAQTRLSCTQTWIGQGASYVLVVDGSHYVLSGFEKELAKASAENTVTISGDLNGKELAVTSVEIPHREK